MSASEDDVHGQAMTIGVLFICTANICRPPMAEGVFRSMAGRAGLDAAFTVDWRALSVAMPASRQHCPQ